MSGSNLLCVLTGSIAAYKACEVVSQLVRRGHRVRAVATPSALRFVGPATLEGLTGAPVLSDLFAPGAALEHVQLTRWADLVLVCPATAHTLNRFAAGLADDLPGALFLAHDRRKPWLVAPAMNPQMWSHPACVAAVDRLREWGVRFLPVGEGRTACGEDGAGRLAEPADIVAAVEAALGAGPGAAAGEEGRTWPVFHPDGAPDAAAPRPRLRILVTSGGTSEPLDGVRVLTNTSTGRTGAELADHLAGRGHTVVLLRARTAVPSRPPVREETFFTFADLDAALARWLAQESFDAVIHAAAVGDFAIDTIVAGGVARPAGDGKLDSDVAPVLRLRPNPKLVDSLRARSRNPDVRIVAFKLTHGAGPAEAEAAVEALFLRSGADLVVHNDLSHRMPGGEFPAAIHGPDAAPPVHCATRQDLAARLEQALLAAAPAPSLNP
ncbi:MAG: NAD-dependent epimerase/dehydratase family protein [Opitutaceae bacterium]|nr:NAD-dependent epimerase/dehydratase family protein [Opitutaceae bacterium]